MDEPNPYEPSSSIAESEDIDHRHLCPVCDTPQAVWTLLKPWGKCKECNCNVVLRLSGIALWGYSFAMVALAIFGYRSFMSIDHMWFVNNLWVFWVVAAIPPLAWLASFSLLIFFGRTHVTTPRRFKPFNAIEVAKMRAKFFAEDKSTT